MTGRGEHVILSRGELAFGLLGGLARVWFGTRCAAFELVAEVFQVGDALLEPVVLHLERMLGARHLGGESDEVAGVVVGRPERAPSSFELRGELFLGGWRGFCGLFVRVNFRSVPGGFGGERVEHRAQFVVRRAERREFVLVALGGHAQLGILREQAVSLGAQGRGAQRANLR